MLSKQSFEKRGKRKGKAEEGQTTQCLKEKGQTIIYKRKPCP
jgi:hypothetical protein